MNSILIWFMNILTIVLHVNMPDINFEFTNELVFFQKIFFINIYFNTDDFLFGRLADYLYFKMAMITQLFLMKRM